VDLNQLLSHHQQAQIAGRWGITEERRAWSRKCAAFYAEQIVQTRKTLGRNDLSTWAQDDAGIACFG
jgi:hypothetical protein